MKRTLRILRKIEVGGYLLSMFHWWPVSAHSFFLMHLAALYSVSGRCESDEGVGKKRSETRREGHTQTQVLM